MANRNNKKKTPEGTRNVVSRKTRTNRLQLSHNDSGFMSSSDDAERLTNAKSSGDFSESLESIETSSVNTTTSFDSETGRAVTAASNTMSSQRASIKTFHMSNTQDGDKDRLDQGDTIFPTVESFVERFVEDPAKRRPIKRILVATNGIAAVRCILSIRRLLMRLFRNDKMIKFICLTTEHEIQSNAEYLKLADSIVHSPTGSNRNNYANVNEIVSHAVEKNVDAVWAGWGHASENPELPRQLAARNIVFIGPPSSAMFSLGDKIASTIIAQTVGIPTIEWSGSGIKMDVSNKKEGETVEVPRDLFTKATVTNYREGLEALERHKIGFPLMIKASEGGGGKGIRKCTRVEQFKEMFEEVCQELPGSPIFLMKCVENARHIEVQLIADRYETVIPVYTRDCSIQRRCQKIIEEAPASVAPEATLRSMQADAVRIAQLVGYESAGTVEYMYLPDENRYFFLELNPRLQVEHPCTEMIAKQLNIPAVQVQIAMGLPLHRITDIRLLFSLPRNGMETLPDDVILTKTDYSVIAARITSEDPDDSFRPSTGSVEQLNFRSSQDVWGYFSVSSGSKVHEFADSQFGHLFARGRTRHEAISAMLIALKELELRATFASQVSYLVDLLMEPDFTNNRFNTQWLDNRIAQKVKQKVDLPMSEIIAISAAVIGHARVTSVFNNFKNAIERGQVLPPTDLTETFLFDLVKDLKIYRVTVTRSAPLTFVVSLNSVTTTVEIVLLGNGGLLVTHGENVFQCGLEETNETFKVAIGRSIIVFEKDNDPSILKSPYTGKLLSYKKDNNEWMEMGETYATVESMKLVFNVEVKKAPGRLVRVANEGDLLYPGSVIARLCDQKDAEKYRPKPFDGIFPEWRKIMDERDFNSAKHYNVSLNNCKNILRGSIPIGGEKEIRETFNAFFSKYLGNENLKALLFQPLIPSFVQSVREPFQSELRNELQKKVLDLERINAIARDSNAPSDEMWKMIEKCEQFSKGSVGYACHVLNDLLKEYIECEKYFEGNVYDDAVAEIKERSSSGEEIVNTIYSHTQLKAKNIFLMAVLETVKSYGLRYIPQLFDNLRALGNLLHTNEVSRTARELLYLNNSIKYRKHLFEAWQEYGREETLSANEAKLVLEKNLIEIMEDMKTNANSSMWKILHEFFFANIGTSVIKKYVENFLPIDDNVRLSKITAGPTTLDVIDFTFTQVENRTHYKVPMDKYSILSVARLEISKADLLYNVLTHEEVTNSLAQHFKNYLHNGTRIPIRVAVLVNVKDYVRYDGLKTTSDNIDELPSLSDDDEKLMHEADRTSVVLREAIMSKLPTLDVASQVIICLPGKPLAQLDMIEVEKLEMWRLPSTATQASMRLSSVHAYQCDDKDNKFSKIFVRQAVNLPSSCLQMLEKDIQAQMFAALDNACTSMNVVMHQNKKKTFVGNHVFLHISCPSLSENLATSLEYSRILNKNIEREIRNQQAILYKHSITEVEVVYGKIKAIDGKPQLINLRVKFLDDTGVTPEIGIYEEFCGATKRKIVARSHSKDLYGPTLEPHSPVRKIEKKRALTRVSGTTYVYDYPSLFGRACFEAWKEFEKTCSGENEDKVNFEDLLSQLPANQKSAYHGGSWRNFLEIKEMILMNGEISTLSDEQELKHRADNGLNECGMVAWILTLYIPEKPQGFQAVVISNDITVQSGSFATIEDDLYALASAYARKHKLPRVNVSCNSGARIGLADDISNLFRVQLKDDSNPHKGYDYLYVDASDKEKVKDQIVYEELDNGRLRVKAVIGRKNETIGVENLQGSGKIAGETSRAYNEIPTYCYVTGRSVGIGAYTARLAHRVVQSRSSHLILTGAPALNTLLGKEVYTSNNQLGGIEIMHKNGVSHAIVDDDYYGIVQLVKWMRYLPNRIKNFPFVQPFGVDTEPRAVELPQQLIDSAGTSRETRQGICDTGSFDEIMSDWAKSIVAGRARLGGIPIGVVSSELRSCETTIPADPAVPGSQAQTLQRAGQVWYPDSAYKTAEAINDFNKEGLPLLFLASLRGFSGGQRDMYDMVLKFGAQIVDALTNYKMPVIVYIPCNGELRGGAWVVLDSEINPGFIHMVADKESRGGILEPNAIVGIKFREPKMSALLKRSDSEILRLQQEMTEAEPVDAEKLQKRVAARVDELKKSYRSAVVEFADLHDRSDRMLATGAVQHVTSLRECRNLFMRVVRNEIVKIKMAESYMRLRPQENHRDAYSWVCQKLGKLIAPEVPLDEQYANMETYLKESFRAVFKKVTEQEAERAASFYARMSRSTDDEMFCDN
ncbi:unnamed protein product [Caenorhabditis auriculariae]|uniref:Acetyl-CoA carboxylase n=1 Tax=Caenorhabditis auriculariae TaxID=2777116 RepID=A0A8S1GP07_9PELO|nr:unnamed protein product [Caenorhabditis auriculariae]